MSSCQHRLWFLEQLVPGNGAYHVPAAIRLVGSLDVAALERSLNAVVARHEILRTTFDEDGGIPYQRIRPEQPVVLAPVPAPGQDGDDWLRQLVARAIREPFDLRVGPLLRASLVQVTSTEHILILVLHHMACDGWSIRLMAREVAALYAEYVEGQPASLPVLPVQYADYALWQRQWAASDEYASQLNYWKRLLQDAPPVLDLPFDFQRPSVQSFKGARHRFEIGGPVARELRKVARTQGATLFMVLLAGFATLLAKYRELADIVVGTPIYGRHHSAFEHLIGYFANTVLIRIKLPPAARFTDVLERVRLAALDAYGHAALPFDDLVEAVQPQRDLSHNPLFQVLFSLQKTPLSAFTLPGVAMEFLDIEMGTSRFDLGVALTEGSTLAASFEYSTDLFTSRTIERMAGHYGALLEAVAREPRRTVATVPLMTAAEQVELRREDAAAEPPEASCLHQLVSESARRWPNRTAVNCRSSSITYGELESRANQLAHRLRHCGVGPETLVPVLLERSIDTIVALLAILKAGAAYVPLDVGYPRERLAQMLDRIERPVIITRSTLAELLPAVDHTPLLIDVAADEIAREPSSAPAVAVRPDNLAYVIYTSGSTGPPKGVAITHRSVSHLLSVAQPLFRFDHTDVWTVVHSYGFDFSVWEMWAPLATGGRLVVVPLEVTLSPHDLYELLVAEAVTVLNQTPSALRQLLDVCDARSSNEPLALRFVVSGGEALSGELATRLARWNAWAWSFYGPTEATVWASTQKVGPEQGACATVPLGRALPGVQLHVVDPHLQPLPIGVPGELVIGGTGVARGYFGQPALTAERFVPDPFSERPGARIYRTGDIAQYNADGGMEFIGRRDHQVKIRGYRIELADVEAAIRRHPATSAAVAAKRTNEAGDAILAAYVVLHPGAELTGSDLRRFLLTLVPQYMVPTDIVFLDALPLSSNGKIDRRRLPDATARPQLHDRLTPPSTHAEQIIAEVWKEVLGLDAVGVDDNFFDLGGQSMLMARAHALLRDRLAPDLTMVEMFQFPTVATLAARIGTTPAASPGARPASTISEAARTADHDRVAAAKPSRDIAIVGMACRTAGAANVDEFWANLKNAVESISPLSDEELLAEGVSPSLLQNPRYVKSASALDRPEYFDEGFFGFTHRDAELLDPQHRVFLETAWEALEHAGYAPSKYDGRIGVFAGTGLNLYGLRHVFTNDDVMSSVGGLQALIASDKDYLTTRVSYKLNLRGPSISVNTACSTSLVAVHLACQSLLAGECEMALAGGVSIKVPQKVGYLYDPAGVTSKDGHCRAFDARASGSVPGNGVGIVVLKRLEDALNQGDTIHSVIKGSAINNDGAAKAGFTAPSVRGQVEVMSRALAAAGIPASSVAYVEAHGTGTVLGDPIEFAALSEVYGNRDGGPPCAIGSVKTNVGHLDTAAGVMGLIKAALCLREGMLTPSLHFDQPNPSMKWNPQSLCVNTTLQRWHRNGAPRRAAVSSLGVGGTNAHVVLEEPAARPSAPESTAWRLLLLSARSQGALESAAQRLARHLVAQPAVRLDDVSATLQLGRTDFSCRRACLVRDRESVVQALVSRDATATIDAIAPTRRAPAFMFPGVGEHFPGMGIDLYREEPIFRMEVDRCCEMLRRRLGHDLREWLYPRNAEHRADDGCAPEAGGSLGRMLAPRDTGDATDPMARPTVIQPAVFVVEYALAQLCRTFGIEPEAVIGYSLGEYAAACVAGIFSLEDALHIVAERARLIEGLPAGAMLAVPLGVEEVGAALADVEVAAILAPSMCVLSGPLEAIAAVERDLARREVASRRLPVSHAFHSRMMEPLVEALAKPLRAVSLRPPAIACLSNTTGTWLTAAEATSQDYWAQHLVRPVRFADCVSALFAESHRIGVEVGPGRGLSSAVAQCGIGENVHDWQAIPLMRTAYDPGGDRWHLLRGVARLWSCGTALSATQPLAAGTARRIPLPTYPFERRRCWLDRNPRSDPAGMTFSYSAPAPFHETPVAAEPVQDVVLDPTVAPAPGLQQTLAQIWQECLGLDRIGVHDNVFDLGAHSLLMTRVIARIKHVLPVEPTLRTMYEAPTIHELAQALEGMLIEKLEQMPDDAVRVLLNQE